MRKLFSHLCAVGAMLAVAAIAAPAAASDISVLRAVYGSKADPGLPMGPIAAGHGADVTSIVGGECSHKANCGGYAGFYHFQDPAPNLVKRLWVIYSCGGGATQTLTAEENQIYGISCGAPVPLGPNYIHVTSAVFGDRNDPGHTNASHMATVTPVVVGRCGGLPTCSVPVSLSLFGDPARNIPKALWVTYSCVYGGTEAASQTASAGENASVSLNCSTPPAVAPSAPAPAPTPTTTAASAPSIHVVSGMINGNIVAGPSAMGGKINAACEGKSVCAVDIHANDYGFGLWQGPPLNLVLHYACKAPDGSLGADHQISTAMETSITLHCP